MKNKKEMIILPATVDDVHSITGIYNEAVFNMYANLEEAELTDAEVYEWFRIHRPPYTIFKCVCDAIFAGYLALSPYKNMKAVISIYIEHNYRGIGIGHALMEHTIKYARERNDINILIAHIISENKASICLHESFGFVKSGSVKKTSGKYNEPVDLCLYRLFVG